MRRLRPSLTAASAPRVLEWLMLRALPLLLLLLLPVLVVPLASLFSGCYGPSCTAACEKAFLDCGLEWLGESQNKSIEQQVQACASACRQDLNVAASEPFAVGWTSCVDQFQCNPDGQGLDLCLGCSSGYYMGRTDGATCTTSEQSSQLSRW